MNRSGFNSILAVAGFIIASVVGAVSIGSGDYAVPALMATVALVLILVSTVGRHLPLDVTVVCIGAGLFYILGKGFAYLNAGGLLFAGESLLLVALLGYLWRCGKGEFPLVPRSPMAIALLLLGGYALIHLAFDFRRFGLMSLRDACVIYYTLFFFFAYQVGQSEQVQKFAPVILIGMAIPGAMLDFSRLLMPSFLDSLLVITVKGNPIIMNHYDAIHPAVFGLILLFASKGASAKGVQMHYYLLMFLTTAYILAIGRGANYVAFALTAVFLLAARQTKLLVGMAGGVVVLACVLMVAIEVNPKLGRDRVRQIEDQLSVIFNPGKGLKAKSQDADTADWRLEWWKKITRDVNAQNPVFGLGFGTDIATDFHRMYFRTANVSPETARTRGAHNAFFTVLARMGWLGGLLFLGVVWAQLGYFWRAMRALRRGVLPPTQAFFWGSNICGFVITFFQYAWEASYSAIPMWMCMGLSYAYLDRVTQEEKETEAAAVPVGVPREMDRPRRVTGQVASV